MLILNDHEVADMGKKLRNHGSKGGYRHECLGYNSRLDELQAAILLTKLKRIDEYNSKRRQKAALYKQLLSGVVTCPVEKEGAVHVYHQYTIRSNRRNDIQKYLKEREMPSVIYYPFPLHQQEAMKFLGHKEGDFPVTEQVSREVLSLPIYPELDERDIHLISDTIRQCLTER
jgi:dTDP-4-amino-4,6-dideoxygalactose transaminase